MSNLKKLIKDNPLMCTVNSLGYNFQDKELVLYLEKEHCVDMTKTIAFARIIDPGVKQIQTFSGNVPDTCYALIEGMWVAQTFKTVSK